VDDVRAFFRGELRSLDTDLRVALGRTQDRTTRLHIEDVRTQIDRALDPAVQEDPAGARPNSDGLFDVSVAPESCWVDYAIRVRK
jgi:hypothetical protein